MTTAHCAVHPDSTARVTPCRRCGSFACEACFEHPDHDLCRTCSEATGELASDLRLDDRGRRRQRWIRKNPRLAGLAYVAGGVSVIAVNFVLIFAMDRYGVVLFPLGGALIGLGVALVVTGKMAGTGASLGQRIFATVLLVAGLLGGIALNFVV